MVLQFSFWRREGNEGVALGCYNSTSERFHLFTAMAVALSNPTTVALPRLRRRYSSPALSPTLPVALSSKSAFQSPAIKGSRLSRQAMQAGCDRSRVFSDVSDLASHSCEESETRSSTGFNLNNFPETDANDLLGIAIISEWPPWSVSTLRSSPMAFTDGVRDRNGGQNTKNTKLPRTSSFFPGNSSARRPLPIDDSLSDCNGACDAIDRRLPAADCAEDSGGGSGGAHGGRFTGRGGGRGGDNEDEGLEGTGMNPTESYYQKALQANPEHPLLLGNYARFLFEVWSSTSVCRLCSALGFLR